MRIVSLAAMLLVGAAVAAPAQTPPASTAPAAAEGIGPAEDAGSNVTGFLTSGADSLHLTPVQRARLRRIHSYFEGLNTPLRDSIRTITGGRPLRDIPPIQRRRMGPALHPLMMAMRANSQAALDSVDAVLTPEQQQRLQAIRAEYRAHRAQAGAPEGR